MRRLVLAVLLTAGMTIPAACGGGGKPFAFPTVSSSDLGVDPEIISSTKPPKETEIRVLKEGTGHPIAAHDLLIADTKGQAWTSGGVPVKPFVNTFSGKHLLFQQIDQTVPGWTKVLPGVKVGSRVLIVNPPKDAFPDGQPGIGITKDDSVVWVLDIVGSMPVDSVATGKPVKAPADAASLPTVTAGKNPTVTIPKIPAPKKLIVQPLLAGTGPKIGAGQVVLAQYTGMTWDSSKVFDTSWKPERGPFNFRVAETDQKTGEQGVIKGWAQGLVGLPVGSRVLLVVPPKFGYGKAGNAQAGISGTDTLVFVIDLLQVFPDPTKASAAAGPK